MVLTDIKTRKFMDEAEPQTSVTRPEDIQDAQNIRPLEGTAHHPELTPTDTSGFVDYGTAKARAVEEDELRTEAASLRRSADVIDGLSPVMTPTGEYLVQDLDGDQLEHYIDKPATRRKVEAALGGLKGIE